MKKFLALTAVLMILSAALMAEAKDFMVEAVVDEDVKLEGIEGGIIAKVGEEKFSNTITVKSTCRAKLSAKADAALKHETPGKTDVIPFEAFIVKGGNKTSIATTEGDVLNALNNSDQFTIKVEIPALTTSVSVGIAKHL